MRRIGPRFVVGASLVVVSSISVGVASVAAAPAPTPTWDARRAHLEAGATVSRRPVPDQGRVRYVASNGSNRADGSATHPWRTVRRALADARRGSTIVVYGRHPGRGDGIYSEQDWGTIERADVTVQAYPGEQPRFLGSRRLPSRERWRRAPTGWYVDLTTWRRDDWPDNPYPIPDQVSDAHPEADDPEQLFAGPTDADLVPLRQIDPDAGLPDRVPDDAFFLERGGGRDDADRLWVGARPRPVMRWSTRQQALRVDPTGHGARLVGLSFEHYAPHHGNTLGAIRILAGGVQLVDVTVAHSSATGIAASGENGTLPRPLRRLVLRRVSAVDNGASGAAIGDASQDGAAPGVRNTIVIERSRFDRNNAAGFDVADCGDGRHCAIAGAKLVGINGLAVRSSTFEHNDANGLWCDLFCERVSIVDNAVLDNSMTGVFYEVSGRAAVVGNVVAGNGAIDASRGPGAARASGMKVTGSVDVRLEHNTFWDNPRRHLFVAADRRDGGPVWHEQSDGAPQVELIGNLFVDGDRGERVVIDTLDGRALEPDWIAGIPRNGYVTAADTVPIGADPSLTRVPSSDLVLADPGTADVRVVDPVVATWADALGAVSR